jgi:hypothetical protein
MGQFTDAGAISTVHRICAMISTCWALGLHRQRLAARRRHADRASDKVPGSTCRRSIRSTKPVFPRGEGCDGDEDGQVDHRSLAGACVSASALLPRGVETQLLD